MLNEADTIIGSTIRNINYEIINMYWNLGRMIAEYKANNDTKYGDAIVKRFREELYLKYGKGFNKSNIYYSVQFYTLFSKELKQTKKRTEIPPVWKIQKNISWSHIRTLLKVKEIKIFNFYLSETEKKKLTKEELIHLIKSKGFERTIANQRKGLIKNENERTIKNPTILGIPNKKRTEKELEDDIVKNITSFMKELGNIVTFYSRQYKLYIKGLIHKIDLIFLDYETDTFILVDLKIGKVTNHDIMQMQLYIKGFSSDLTKKANVIGLILCEATDYRLIEDDNIYQIKYLSEMPKEKELLKIINENKIILLKTKEFIIN